MTEIEPGVLARHCLDRRIPSREVLEWETGIWREQRNLDVIRADWRLTPKGARIKLKSR